MREVKKGFKEAVVMHGGTVKWQSVGGKRRKSMGKPLRLFGLV